ncbi:MAG: sigma-70 family RNA polymerase sigma factor [Thermaerobacter sp.]|nr:sigma-70 family RNA polymerase sigma factor [Thermaerobacter sp.]
MDRLYRDQFDALVRRARWLVGDEAAEDLAQEAFVRLWHTPPRDADRMKPYLRVILARLAVDRWRRDGQRAVAAAAVEPDPEPGPEAQALLGEAWEEVQSAMDELPERDRQALWMRATGCPYREIGTRLGIPVGQVGVVLWRAVNKVRGRVLDASDRLPRAERQGERGHGQ